MKNSLSRFLAPPVFTEDEEKTRSAGFINAIVLTNIPILVLFIIIRVATGSGELFGSANLILAAIIATLSIVWLLMRAGWVRLAGYLHVTTIWLASTMIALLSGGINSTIFTSYFVVMLMAGLLLGWRPAVGFTFLSILAVFRLANSETFGAALEGTVLFIFGAIFLYLIISSLQKAVQRAQANASELRGSNQQLTELRDLLELVGFEEIEHACGVSDGTLLRVSQVRGGDRHDRDDRNEHEATSESTRIHVRSKPPYHRPYRSGNRPPSCILSVDIIQ